MTNGVERDFPPIELGFVADKEFLEKSSTVAHLLWLINDFFGRNPELYSRQTFPQLLFAYQWFEEYASFYCFDWKTQDDDKVCISFSLDKNWIKDLMAARREAGYWDSRRENREWEESGFKIEKLPKFPRYDLEISLDADKERIMLVVDSPGQEDLSGNKFSLDIIGERPDFAENKKAFPVLRDFFGKGEISFPLSDVKPVLDEQIEFLKEVQRALRS